MIAVIIVAIVMSTICQIVHMLCEVYKYDCDIELYKVKLATERVNETQAQRLDRDRSIDNLIIQRRM